jgi:hypothetical protein
LDFRNSEALGVARSTLGGGGKTGVSKTKCKAAVVRALFTAVES